MMERRRAASAASAASAAAAAIATAAAVAAGSAAGSICGGPGGGAVDDEEEGKDEGEGGATPPYLGLDHRPSPSPSPSSFPSSSLPKGKGAPGRRRQAMSALEVSIFNLQNSIAAHQANTVNEQILVKAADIVRTFHIYI